MAFPPAKKAAGKPAAKKAAGKPNPFAKKSASAGKAGAKCSKCGGSGKC